VLRRNAGQQGRPFSQHDLTAIAAMGSVPAPPPPRSGPPLTLQVNGEQRACAAGLTLEQALVALGYDPRLVVVEYNGDILPRSHWSGRMVQESDCLEVVTIVGGGT